MKRLAVGLFLVLSAQAQMTQIGTQVAIVSGGTRKHQDEYDGALKQLTSWSADRFTTETADSIAALIANLNRYDLILTCPLMNYGNKGVGEPRDFKEHAEALRKFVQNGGGLVVMDACYPTSVNWLKNIDARFDIANFARDRTLGNLTVDSRPPSPLRYFPTLLNESASWAALTLPERSSWEVVTRLGNDDGPVLTAVQRYGKGLVYVTTQRQPGAGALQNLRAYLAACRLGLAITAEGPVRFEAGQGRCLTFHAKNITDKPTEFKVIFPRGSEKAAETNLFLNAGESLTYSRPYAFQTYGSTPIYVGLASGAREEPLIDCHVKLPELLEVIPRAGRGIFSAARRDDTATFTVKLSPADQQKPESLRLEMTILDIAERVIATTQWVGAAVSTLQLPFPKTLPPGTYTLQTRALGLNPKNRSEWITWRNAVVSTPLLVLPVRPSQTIIDQDGTFLVEGKPFFPLGLYHVHPGELTNAVKATGINLIQQFSWFGENGLNAARDLGVKVIWEQAHAGAPDAIPNAVRSVGRHPAIFAWYGMDEPYESQFDEARKRMERYHALDLHHPTYMVSCRPLLFQQHAQLADIFAPDPYPLGEACDPSGDVEMVAQWMDKGWAATERAKPVICVPQSFGKEPLPMFRCMAYLALTHDARGLIWYPWKQQGGGRLGIGVGTNPAQQAAMKQLVDEIKAMSPALLSPDRRMFQSTDGNIHALLCREDPPNGKSSYTLLLVNGKKVPVKTTLAIPELNGTKTIKELFGHATLTVETPGNAPQLTIPFAPYQTRVYKW